MNTTYFINCVAGNVFKTKTTPALPSTYYLGLSKTEPTVAGGNVSEPASGAGYTRMKIENLTTPTEGLITNSQMISFPESTASWGVITHFVIFDAASGGNLLMYGAFADKRTVEDGTVLTIKANHLELSVTQP